MSKLRAAARTFARIVALVALTCAPPATARADDGYDSAFAKAVRDATEQYRLQLWAAGDGYIQSTTYVAGLGVMFTNHDRFSPQDLAHPTVLIYDEAGRLVAVEYQFANGAAPSAAFSGVPSSAWYDIPRHLHYNIRVGASTYYVQSEWPTDDAPTADALRKRSLMPSDGTLLFAFIHPKTRAINVWAWLPNEDGLFAGANAMLP